MNDLKAHEKTRLVSIALCTYNGAQWLVPQLESILNQTYSNIELIIVDDASTDKSAKIARQFAAQESRIKYFINEKNLGYNKNFEKAFSLCSGDYIAISDQDDIWERDKIEVMMREWPADALMVYSISGEFYGDDRSTYKEKKGIIHSNIDDTRKVLFGSDVVGHNSIIKKELLDLARPFPEDIYYDWWLCMHAASYSYIAVIPRVLTWHRYHDQNISQRITDIKDTLKKQQILRDQYAHLVETFFERNKGREKERESLLKYAALLRKMDGKHFNRQMFSYVLKNRDLIFHYKQKTFVSKLKHAIRMGFKGLLRT